MIERCEVLPRMFAVQGERSRVALIEMPPYSSGRTDFAQERSASGFTWGHLDETKEWFAAIPVEILLQEGVVRKVMGPEELPNLKNRTTEAVRMVRHVRNPQDSS